MSQLNNILLGSHVGMSGKEMFLGSAKEAVSECLSLSISSLICESFSI